MIDVSARRVSRGPAFATLFCAIVRILSPLLLGLLLAAPGPARAQDTDDRYLRIYYLIQDADALAGTGSPNALAKYREALAQMQAFQREHRDWNPEVVSYRINYLAQKMAALSGKAEPTAASGSNAPPPAAAPVKPAVAAALPSGVQVKVLAAGAEPRKVLRFHPKPGDQRTTEMTLKMGMEMNMGETQMPATKLPGIKLVIDTTVKSLTGDGDISFESVISDVSLAEQADAAAPQMAEMIKAQLAGAKGVSGKGTLSARGFNKGIEMKAPAGADPQARQTIDQIKDFFSNLTTPLPDEAVGAGARWEVQMPVKSQGMTIQETTTYNLVSIEGERFKTHTTISQRAARQKIQSPAMPGLTVDLEKMSGTGTGDTTFDLTQIMPAAATGEIHSERTMSMNQGGQKQTFGMKLDVSVKIEGK